MTIKYKQHQQKVLDFFYKNNPRGILLYHGLGSGKTITAIGISELYNNDVVCIVPASMRTQWKKELKLVGVKNNYNIYSYEEISKMINMNNEMILLNNKTIIIDEAHRLRNTGTISKRIIKATKKSTRILLLTGTPMVNGPEDFSNLANLIYGDLIMPNNIKGFNDKFFKIKNKKMPPVKDRCLLYSPVTCRDNGYKKNSKSKYCIYHQYMYDKRLPLKKRKEIKFNSKSLIISDEKKRIMNLRTRYKFTPKIPNTKEFSKYVECLTSYYFPDIYKDYPSVTRNKIEVQMTAKQNIEYKKH